MSRTTYSGSLSHAGAGWKNREFWGHLYSFDRGNSNYLGRRFVSTEIGHQFWDIPRAHLCDSTTNTVWIQGDRRIQGYLLNEENGKFNTKYVFNVTNEPKESLSQSTPKRHKTGDVDAEHGDTNLLLLGPDRIGYLKSFRLLEWKLCPENCHDGIERMCNMDSAEEDLAQWPEDDVLDLHENTWMDDSGAAEVTRGIKPDSNKIVDIVTPYSVGYVSQSRLAMSNRNNAIIRIRDQDMREVSGLVGFGATSFIEIVQRPTFEMAGDENTFVACDQACVKIFDLRTGKAEMTIKQQCVSVTPLYHCSSKFIINQLYRGQGSMLWDLRNKKPLYSLPIGADKGIAWVPTSEQNKPPILMVSNGEAFKFGRDSPKRNEEWEREAAKEAWSKLEQAGLRRGAEYPSDCCIM